MTDIENGINTGKQEEELPKQLAPDDESLVILEVGKTYQLTTSDHMNGLGYTVTSLGEKGYWVILETGLWMNIPHGSELHICSVATIPVDPKVLGEVLEREMLLVMQQKGVDISNGEKRRALASIRVDKILEKLYPNG